MDPTPTPVTPPPLVMPASGGHKMFFVLGFVFILILVLIGSAVYYFFFKPAVTPKPIPVPTPVVEVIPPATTSAVPATYFHKVCLGSACKTVDCAPPTVPCTDSCATDAACGNVTVSHKECRNKACVTVNGAGKDACTSDVSCQPKAVAPPIPQAGNPFLTIAGIVLGLGVLGLGFLFVL